MSVPYGAPQQQQPQAGSPAQPAGGPQPTGGLGLETILAIVGAGLGLVVYLLAFGEEYIAPYFNLGGGSGTSLLVVAGIIAGLALLPKGPQLQLLSVVLVVLGVLALLQTVVHWPGDVSAMAIVALIVGIIQAGAIVASWLFKEGIIKAAPKPAYPQQGNWNPQSGGIPQAGQYGQPQAPYGQAEQQQPYGQQAAAPGTGGQPAAPAPQYGHQGTEIFGGVAQQQPGQYGQQAPPPPGGYGQG